MEMHKNFIFLKELEEAELPVYQIVKESYFDDLAKEEEFREIGCVGMALLNLIVARNLQGTDTRIEVFNDIKKGLPVGGIRIQDLLTYSENSKYFAGLVRKDLANPTFAVAWSVLNLLSRVIVCFSTVDGGHASFMEIKNKKIYSDGIEIDFEAFLMIIYSGKTYICCFLNEEEQTEFL